MAVRVPILALVPSLVPDLGFVLVLFLIPVLFPLLASFPAAFLIMVLLPATFPISRTWISCSQGLNLCFLPSERGTPLQCLLLQLASLRNAHCSSPMFLYLYACGSTLDIYVHMYIHTHTHTCMCVCVCVCM